MCEADFSETIVKDIVSMICKCFHSLWDGCPDEDEKPQENLLEGVLNVLFSKEG